VQVNPEAAVLECKCAQHAEKIPGTVKTDFGTGKEIPDSEDRIRVFHHCETDPAGQRVITHSRWTTRWGNKVCGICHPPAMEHHAVKWEQQALPLWEGSPSDLW